MDPLVVDRLARADGPDKLTSDDYSIDYEEVRMLGSATSTVRSTAQTDTARFFNSNAATLVGDALVRYLETHPLTLEATARMFAAMHGALTDSIITCWQLKRDVGFWRPGGGHRRLRAPTAIPTPGWRPGGRPSSHRFRCTPTTSAATAASPRPRWR